MSKRRLATERKNRLWRAGKVTHASNGWEAQLIL